MLKLKLQYFGHMMQKNWLIGKDPNAGRDWRQEEKGMTEDEMVGWHHRLNGHEFEQALGIGDGQGSLVCCSPRGWEESDTTEQLNWTDSSSMKYTIGVLIEISLNLWTVLGNMTISKILVFPVCVHSTHFLFVNVVFNLFHQCLRVAQVQAFFLFS